MSIDLYDPALFASGHPAEVYRTLRQSPRLHWNPEPGARGYWAVTRFADVLDIERDFQTFSSEPTIMIADPLASVTLGDAKMMLMIDPPQHTGFRKLIRGAFSKDASLERSDWLEDLARRIVDAVIERGECDFVADIAGEMPSYVIAHLMGLPLADGRELYKLTEIIHSAPETLPPNAGAEAVAKMFAYGMQVIVEKRARPAEDLATRLLEAEVDGKRLSDEEFLLFFLLLIDAGGDTTRNLLGGGLLALLAEPAALKWLREDIPARLPAAREELLRYISPVIYMRRTATRDTRIGETEIAAGDKVVLYYGAANRDAERFRDPERLDLARTPNEHLAFGAGPHVCLGQHLARLEIDAMLREILMRMHDIEVTEAPEWLASTFISGPRRLPIRFRPGTRAG